ncbi:spondin-1-like [Morone saxatilis]|uniref:spondin-1-like n=1 Tax=Morone saxatilis TaxID=34816 RepID=UPI0015E24EEE|nr:spondin-1-like [Morone saxatilis]
MGLFDKDDDGEELFVYRGVKMMFDTLEKGDELFSWQSEPSSGYCLTYRSLDLIPIPQDTLQADQLIHSDIMHVDGSVHQENKGDEVLTVIKTKAQWPAWQPLNLRAAPSAEFSVDRTRHLMSFLTMLGPSPDWNVGLSGEDLCTKECGWVQRLVTDLIPWDAGTDNGVTYESPNKPTIPQEKIRPLTSLDHPQSPFYDPEGGAITPVAKVLVERIARKGEQCNVVPDTIDDIVADIGQEEKEEDDTPETCIYSGWSPWSACSSATCDKGRRMRQRMLKAQLDLSVPCPHTQDFEPCMGPGCSDEGGSCF